MTNAAPWGGNLLPPGATGGVIKFNPGGSQHVSIYGPSAHVSYDRFGTDVTRVHGTIHDTWGRSNLVVPPVDLGYGG